MGAPCVGWGVRWGPASFLFTSAGLCARGCSRGPQRLRRPGGGWTAPIWWRVMAQRPQHLNWAASRHSSTLGRWERWYRRVWATFRGASLSLRACFRAAMLCSWSVISRSVCTQDGPWVNPALGLIHTGWPVGHPRPGSYPHRTAPWVNPHPKPYPVLLGAVRKKGGCARPPQPCHGHPEARGGAGGGQQSSVHSGSVLRAPALRSPDPDPGQVLWRQRQQRSPREPRVRALLSQGQHQGHPLKS